MESFAHFSWRGLDRLLGPRRLSLCEMRSYVIRAAHCGVGAIRPTKFYKVEWAEQQSIIPCKCYLLG